MIYAENWLLGPERRIIKGQHFVAGWCFLSHIGELTKAEKASASEESIICPARALGPDLGPILAEADESIRLLMPSPEIVHVLTGGPDWTAIAGIAGTAVVGLLGPVFADRRRFGQDRRLKAVDDLRAMIDEVEDRLEHLGEKCAVMRQKTMTYGDDPEHLVPALQEAEDSYQLARAAIARLSIRPHAGASLVDRATDSSLRYMDAIKAARTTLTARSMGPHASTSAVMAITTIPGFVEDGIHATRAYEAAARAALGQILGGTEKPRMK